MGGRQNRRGEERRASIIALECEFSNLPCAKKHGSFSSWSRSRVLRPRSYDRPQNELHTAAAPGVPFAIFSKPKQRTRVEDSYQDPAVLILVSSDSYEWRGLFPATPSRKKNKQTAEITKLQKKMVYVQYVRIHVIKTINAANQPIYRPRQEGV